MPARNALKIYTENSFYHIYNRGVEKRKIFIDQQDCSVFLSYLKDYLTPKDVKGLKQSLASKDSSAPEKNKALKMLSLRNFSSEIDLLCYVLMPNHFHLLIRQKSYNSIDHFMRAIGTRYTIYFNKKYRRVGSLCQGVYKAVLVSSDEQLLHLSRYIHTNPTEIGTLESQPSSMPEFLGLRQTPWIKPQPILDFFSKNDPHDSYKKFVSGSPSIDISIISQVALDFTDED